MMTALASSDPTTATRRGSRSAILVLVSPATFLFLGFQQNTMPALKKEYVLVSSDQRDSTSRSTTDFTVRLPVPLVDVVKTDLVQVVMDYRVANVVAPATSLTIYEATSSRDLALEEGLYTPYELREELQRILGDPYIVTLSAANKIAIELPLADEEPPTPDRRLVVTSSTLRSILGLTSSPLTPIYSPTDGAYGSYTWRFPRAVNLSQTAPYMFIQSNSLGTDIRTASNSIGFYRMLLNDPANGVVAMTNNRVDTYSDTPRTLQDLDVRLTFPDGQVVNNRGGSFTLLLEIVRQTHQ